MKKEIPDQDHVSRYCKPSDVDNEMIQSTAFQDFKGDVSVNWLEYFGPRGICENVDSVRNAFQTKGYSLRANGRFAVLNVGLAKDAVMESCKCALIFEHKEQVDDPSHSVIRGYAGGDLKVAIELTALAQQYTLYPAIV